MTSSGMLRRVVLVRTARRNIPEYAIHHSRRHENLKSYMWGLVQISRPPGYGDRNYKQELDVIPK
jgi:hypothetical protein